MSNSKLKLLLSKHQHRFLSSIAAFSFLMVATAANINCWYIMYQDSLPDGAKKLRKFK